jgi:AMP nucleosidase
MESNLKEAEIARQTLERYAGCEAAHFFPNLILTNFPRYVEHFAKERNIPVCEGSVRRIDVQGCP